MNSAALSGTRGSSLALRKSDRRPLHRAFIKAMRRHPFRLAMADQTRPHVSCLQALIGAIVLARALKTHWQDQQHVGLLLPPTVAGALTNVAATLAGRTSVNLNYTVGKAGLESAVRQANLRTIVTSRKFVEKAKLELPDGPTILWLEDIAATIGGPQKAMAAALALLAPLRIIEFACGQRERVTMDHLATIIFSSGSTGEPKGVMLSHFNIDANVQAVSQVLPLDAKDRILGILPLFHSFGYLVFWYVSPQRRGHRLSSVPPRCDGDRRTLRQTSPHVFRLHAHLSAALPAPLHPGTIQHPCGSS